MNDTRIRRDDHGGTAIVDDTAAQLLHNLYGAARIVLGSTADPVERSCASRFLEEWVQNPHAWAQFGTWLRHLVRRTTNRGRAEGGDRAAATTPTLLLCLQLLQTKARKSLPYVESGTPIELTVRDRLNDIYSVLSELVFADTGNQTKAATGSATAEPRISCAGGTAASSVAPSAFAALACLSVRAGGMPDLIGRCVESLLTTDANTNHAMPVVAALKILECIPAELEACALPSSRISSALAPFVPAILEAVRTLLLTTGSPTLALTNGTATAAWAGAGTVEAALKALASWIRTGHVSLSALNAPPPSTEPTLLAVLARIISIVPQSRDAGDHGYDDNPWEAVVEVACDALGEAVRVPTDTCTVERQRALAVMLQSPGFIVAPLQYASEAPTGTHEDRASAMSRDSWEANGDAGDDEDGSCRWENGSRALASLLCTLVCEHVDDWVTKDGTLRSPSYPLGGAGDVLPSLLLDLQHHPLLAVRITVLDVWLAVQDVPTSERAEEWKKPLFSRLLPVLLWSCRYPASYDSDGGGWDDAIVDESEWKEYRRLASDVLASTYLLLRANFMDVCLRDILSLNSEGADWRAGEVALYGLVAVARDVCARIKSGAGSGGGITRSAPEQKSLVTIDRERTAHSLQGLVQSLCGSAPHDAVSSLSRIHARVLEATSDFLGAYSPAWTTMFASPDAPLQLLAFLHRAMPVQHDATSAAKSIRSILIACSLVLAAAEATQLVPLFQGLMESSVTIPSDDVLSSVVEGCTRLLVQVKQEAVVSQCLAAMIDPLTTSIGSALQHLQSTASADASVVAVEMLGRCLLGLQILIQFCDHLFSDGDNISPLMAGLLNAVWQTLEQASRYALSRPSPSSLLDRVLSVHEQLLKTVPSQMAPHMEGTIEQALGIFERTRDAAALRYVARAVEVYGASNVPSFRNVLERVSSGVSVAVASDPSSAELVASYFELCHRYLLYCPAALIECPQFPSIARFAADSVASSEADRECARAALHLLGQLFGYRTLAAIPASSRQLLGAASSRIDEVLHSLGGVVASRCVHALAGGGSQMLWPPAVDCLYAVLSSGPAAIPTPDGSTVGRQWLESSRPSTTDEVLFRQVSSLLFDVLADGPAKGRAKVRMLLTDFGKVQAGEASADCLITYSYS